MLAQMPTWCPLLIKIHSNWSLKVCFRSYFAFKSKSLVFRFTLSLLNSITGTGQLLFMLCTVQGQPVDWACLYWLGLPLPHRGDLSLSKNASKMNSQCSHCVFMHLCELQHLLYVCSSVSNAVHLN